MKLKKIAKYLDLSVDVEIFCCDTGVEKSIWKGAMYNLEAGLNSKAEENRRYISECITDNATDDLKSIKKAKKLKHYYIEKESIYPTRDDDGNYCFDIWVTKNKTDN